MREYRLGRLPSDHNDKVRRLQLADYYALPTVPPSTNWRSKAAASLNTVLGNDQHGDCVVCAGAHIEGVTSANSEKAERVYTTKEIVDIYYKLTGGADNGLNMLHFLKYWQKTGILGHKCGAYLSIPNDMNTIKSCIAIFGTVFAAFAPVPQDWMENPIWNRPSRGAGGHAIAFVDYDESYLYVSTWGEIRKATALALPIFDEVYVVLDPDWIKNAPNGFDTASLIKDFNSLGGNEPVPPVVDPVEPPPEPPKPEPVPIDTNWLKLILDIIKAILEVFKK
jgi:hypothetical protein